MNQYPKTTGKFCPSCSGAVIEDQVEQTHYDPSERHGAGFTMGVGFYCETDECDHSVEPIEEDELLDTPNAKTEESK